MLMQDITRFTANATPAPVLATPLRAGLLAGTRVETASGWRAVESLCRGDQVHSFDGGLRPVVAVDRDWLVPGADTVLLLPGGALHTSGDLKLLPGQLMLLDAWDDALTGGAPVALGPAAAFEGLFGTRRAAVTRPLEVVTPIFAEEEGIYIDGGLVMHCPGVAAGPNGRSEDEFFARLDTATTRTLLTRRGGAAAA
jgi:hypothetical protein